MAEQTTKLRSKLLQLREELERLLEISRGGTRTVDLDEDNIVFGCPGAGADIFEAPGFGEGISWREDRAIFDSDVFD